MNVLLTLEAGIARHGLREPLFWAGHDISQIQRLREIPIPNTKTTKDRNKLGRIAQEDLSLVGKGSHFERLSVQDFLNPFSGHRFARHKLASTTIQRE